uniref:PDZ domain-containing protein n=1 Tax=viral metagenome TaxID=1070528 RepID=A0A6C0J7L3_9ZZZZ
MGLTELPKINVLFNNNLTSDIWNKRMSCEQCMPIESPVCTKHDVVTLKSLSNKIFIFSYEDNAPLIQGKEYMFSIYIYVDELANGDGFTYTQMPYSNDEYNEDFYLNHNVEDDDQHLESIATMTNVTSLTIDDKENGIGKNEKKSKVKPVKMAIFKGRYFNESNILSSFEKPEYNNRWCKLTWLFTIGESYSKREANGQRISLYLKHTENMIISLWKPELFCLSGIYEPDLYKNFDFFNMSINLFNDYKNSCVNIYNGNKNQVNLTGFLINKKYICTVYNKENSLVYAQIFPSGVITPLTLIGFDKIIGIALYEIPENAKLQTNNTFLILEPNNNITKTMLICTMNRQYSTCKHQVTPGFITNELNNISVNDGMFQTTFENSKNTLGQPVLNPNGELIGMLANFSSNGNVSMCISVNLLNKIFSRIIKAYETNNKNIPLELNGAFMGIKYHYITLQEKVNLMIENRETIVVDNVYKNSPAFNAGIKDGDIIMNFSKNNSPVGFMSFFEYIYTKKVDSKICFEYCKNYSLDRRIPIELVIDSRRRFTNLPENYL